MAHSWVQLFDSELDAFRAYTYIYSSSCTLLVDTYNVLKSGVPNAIKVFNEVVVPRGVPSRRNPHRQRRHHLPVPQGQKDARRGRIPRL